MAWHSHLFNQHFHGGPADALLRKHERINGPPQAHVRLVRDGDNRQILGYLHAAQPGGINDWVVVSN